MCAWRITHKQTVVWCKEAERRGLGGMFGSALEFLLVGQRINPGTNAHGKRTTGVREPRNWYTWSVGAHSEKPEAAYQVIQQVCLGPFIDVFARRTRSGWTCVGDAIDGTDIHEALWQVIRSDPGPGCGTLPP